MAYLSIGSRWLKSHVLYASNKLVVLNKPNGLICQLNHSLLKSKSRREEMFLNPVFEAIRKFISPNADPHSVHRLDKLTTGCLLVALNHSSAKSLSTQLQHNEVKKTYLALVRGGPKSFPATEGEINDEILYSDGRAELHPTGKQAKTRWKVIGCSPLVPVSLLELDLVTGNKHQLRIHLAKALRVPIIGDTVYSRKPLNSSITSLTSIPDERLFLHSSEISCFQYSESGRRYTLTITAPVPVDFEKICTDLDIQLPSSNKKASVLVDHRSQDGESTPRLLDSTENL